MSADGATVVSAGASLIEVWDARAEMASSGAQSSGGAGCCAVSGDGMALTVHAFEVRLWNVQDATSQRVLSRGQFGSCAISADGRIAITGAWGKVEVWDSRDWTSLYVNEFGRSTNDPGSWFARTTCAISLDGTNAVAAHRGLLVVLDTRSGAERDRLTTSTDFDGCCAMSADGSLVVGASSDGLLTLWRKLADVEQHDLGRPLSSCAVSLDGALVAVGRRDGTLTLWDVSGGGSRWTREGPGSTIRACSISADARFVASAAAAGTLTVWAADSGECLTTLHVDGRLADCAWAPDGRHLIAVGDRGVYFLELTA